MVRSLHEYVSKDETEWPESSHGDRGKSIAKVHFRGLEQRDMNLGNFSEGGALETSRQPRATDVISYLRAKTLGRRLGVNYPDVTAADFSVLPRVTLGAGLTFVGEGGAPAEAALTFGAVMPSLRTGIAWGDLSYNLWRQIGGVAEEIVTRDLFDAVAAGVDRTLFHGDGGAEPLGIASALGIDISSGATFSLAKACDRLRVVEDGNGDSIFWAMSPDVAEILRQREAGTAGYPGYIFTNGRILDKPALVSNSIDAGFLFCGDFTRASVMIRDIELLVDRSSKSTQGAKRLVIFVYCDVVLTQPGCFSVAQGVS
jgi:HK97 family phage major capsid protein